MTQAQQLYKALRPRGQRGMSYLELSLLGISVCPHKRMAEGVAHLRDGERLERFREASGRVRFRIVRSC